MVCSQQFERRPSLRYRSLGGLVAFVIFLTAGSVWAHHSPSSIFDMTKPFIQTGTLTQVEWVNPHIAIYLDAKKADGTGVENWKWESAPPAFLRRVGVTSSQFKSAIGQTVSASGFRAKDGSLYGFLTKITFADGTSLEMVAPGAPGSR